MSRALRQRIEQVERLLGVGQERIVIGLRNLSTGTLKLIETPSGRVLEEEAEDEMTDWYRGLRGGVEEDVQNEG